MTGDRRLREATDIIQDVALAAAATSARPVLDELPPALVARIAAFLGTRHGGVTPPRTCRFLTVPNMTLSYGDPHRLVVCGLPATAHPVVGINRFTNHLRYVEAMT